MYKTNEYVVFCRDTNLTIGRTPVVFTVPAMTMAKVKKVGGRLTMLRLLMDGLPKAITHVHLTHEELRDLTFPSWKGENVLSTLSEAALRTVVDSSPQHPVHDWEKFAVIARSAADSKDESRWSIFQHGALLLGEEDIDKVLNSAYGTQLRILCDDDMVVALYMVEPDVCYAKLLGCAG